MQHQKKLENVRDVVEIIKQLPENDRLLLGLHLYEKLSLDQVKMVLEKIPAEINDPELSR
jgi:DNA-directed RNA polymerase specialized sigma subunit